MAYKKKLISELLLEAMHINLISVRDLAKKSGLSPALVQNIRSGKNPSPTLKSLIQIFSPLGYNIFIGNKMKTHPLKIK